MKNKKKSFVRWLRSWFPVLWPNSAGRISFTWLGFAFHVLPREAYIDWGYAEIWHDGPHFEFGFGPLLLITWSGSFREALRTSYERGWDEQ